jgi:hypothetical protein
MKVFVYDTGMQEGLGQLCRQRRSAARLPGFEYGDKQCDEVYRRQKKFFYAPLRIALCLIKKKDRLHKNRRQ